jgi:hypothetical protein
MTEDTLDEYEKDRQVLTLPYPYVYTFYTVEHFLDSHKFDIRYCNIGKGRIIVHFNDTNLLIRGHEGHMDLRIEPKGNDTVLSMEASYYLNLKDEDLYTFRKDFLTTVQLWLEREYTMILPSHLGDIPRFRQNEDGTALIDRSVDLAMPDTLPLTKQLIYLGSSIMIGGIIIDVLIGFLPAYWGMNMAILTGLPFMLMAVMVEQGRFASAMEQYSFFGWMAGIIFCAFTLLIGILIVMFPAVYVDYHASRIRVWNVYFEDLYGSVQDGSSTSDTSVLTKAYQGQRCELNVVGGKI